MRTGRHGITMKPRAEMAVADGEARMDALADEHAFFSDAIVSRATRGAFVAPSSTLSQRVSYG